MFKFFFDSKWSLWAWPGAIIILSKIWFQVQIDVKINEWFGEFYDMIQNALAEPNSITIDEYWASLFSFITLAGIYVALAVIISFFTNHYLFRWRTSMVEWYHSVYDKARKIEGASQRVQEDTVKFSRIMESLGTSFISSVLIIIEFTPILFGLSVGIPIFFFGDWEYGLMTGALIWSVGGTLFLIILGIIVKIFLIEYILRWSDSKKYSSNCKLDLVLLQKVKNYLNNLDLKDKIKLMLVLEEIDHFVFVEFKESVRSLKREEARNPGVVYEI